jgi:hypothetical protein
VDWSTCICMVVFVNSASNNCKVVLATSRRSRLQQVKSHNPRATSQILFICEYGVSIEHSHHTSSAAMKKCLSLGGTSTVAKCDVKEVFCSISWYFLVKWRATLPSEGVEKDIFFNLCFIYIKEVFNGFSPPQGFPRIICVSIFSVIASLPMILFM